MRWGSALILVLAHVNADTYMHIPRGSNNRLNEKSANRNNGNRLFDSQNNNRGGYNVGDKTTAAFGQCGADCDEPDSKFNKELNVNQYSFVHYSGSELPVEWTAQHGCGGEGNTETQDETVNKLNCNMVVQYMCNTEVSVTDKAMMVELKDGRNTDTPDAANSFANIETRKDQNDNAARGRHESEGFYYECENRPRNKGLFTADQNLKGNTMKYTRQNPNGNRRGLECPEERDYYPNWTPSPWIDVLVDTNDVPFCKTQMSAMSQNVADKYKCTYDGASDNIRKEAFEKQNKVDCEDVENASWETFNHGVAPPECRLAQWSRVNHLGNGADGQMNGFKWIVPHHDSMPVHVAKPEGLAKCILRIRYNISTGDYDYRTDAKSNNDKNQRYGASPVVQNPTVPVGINNMMGLKLAINTAQFGRTFQDRSHTFYIKDQTATTEGTAQLNTMISGARLYNVNVRGKRGNIVQTFPAVEYDFVPHNLPLKEGDVIHFQWTGSNTHNNGNPAGDGQAGDAGEGTGGTDRHNLACTSGTDTNYPCPLTDQLESMSLFSDLNSECWIFEKGQDKENGDEPIKLNTEDCTMFALSGGYHKSVAAAVANDNMNQLLNNVSPSLHGGFFLKMKKKGTYYYMNTRNNNFSNRDQRGKITVVA